MNCPVCAQIYPQLCPVHGGGAKFTDVQIPYDEFVAYKRDAERYRWVRTAGAFESESGLDVLSENPEKYDAAVDENIKLSKGNRS